MLALVLAAVLAVSGADPRGPPRFNLVRNHGPPTLGRINLNIQTNFFSKDGGVEVSNQGPPTSRDTNTNTVTKDVAVENTTGVLTTSSGCPIQTKQTSGLNSNLIRNEYFVDSITHLVNERIPERFVHAKGTGAYGYFECTDDVTDLTKAKFLSSVGKRTRVAARFSQTLFQKGQSDIGYSIHGFAVKFYTEDGNFDIPGFHTPVFNSRDPLDFFSLIHAFKPNPATNVADTNTLWDYLTLKPEAFFAVFMGLSPYGLPENYRTILGHSIHTMQLANANNETSFTRFYFTPDLGLQNMTVGSTNDTNHFRRDMYEAIANKTYPSWTVWMQPLTTEDVKNASNYGVDLFDVTREIYTSDFPLRKIGKLVLNENPKNYFADIEQLAFCPGNVVPGIVGGPDQLFAGRSLAYRNAQIYRLGVNFNKIETNRPNRTVATYNRDGVSPVLDNEGGGTNYYPNSFNGPQPVADNEPDLVEITEITTSNLDQAGAFYRRMSDADKLVTATNIAGSFLGVADEVIAKALVLLGEVDSDLLSSVTTILTAAAASS